MTPHLLESSPHGAITVRYALPRRGLPAANTLRRFAKAALEHERKVALLLRVIDEHESATMNHTYRNQATPTNVLSFPLHAPLGDAGTYLGDILICAPVVLREAAAQGKTPAAHWAHMVVHGVLHLRGYDHIQADDALIMESLESRILNQLAYPNPYE